MFMSALQTNHSRTITMVFLSQISTLKDRLTEKDSYYHGELEKAQTNADRDIFDLRRKLDKIDLSYQDQMEKLTEKYEKEIGEDHEEGFGNGRTVP